MKQERSCRDLAERLELFLEEKLSSTELSGFQFHLEECGKCRQLIETCQNIQGSENSESVVDEVLAQTSGSACIRTRSMLCDYADDRLRGEDIFLIQTHLSHCPRCAEIVSVLEESAILLPQLASLDPGPFFTHSVVAASRFDQRPTKWGGLLSGLSAVFDRPRFSIEAAYIGALLIFVIFGGSPVKSVGGIASATLAGFQFNLSRLTQAVPATLSESWNGFYVSCETQVEPRFRAVEVALESACQVLEESAQDLRDVPKDYVLDPADKLYQDATAKYHQYVQSSNGDKHPEAPPTR